MANTSVGNIAIGFIAAAGGFTGGANKIIKQLGQIKMAGDVLQKGWGAMTETFERMDTLVDTADNLGIATDALISLRFAAEQGGSSAAGMDSALAGMNKNVGLAAMGMGRAGESIKALGLDVNKLKTQSPDQLFATFAEAISKVQDKTEQAAIASRIFGDEGGKMLNLLRGGEAGLAGSAAQAEALGLHFGESARKAAEAHDAMRRLDAVLGTLSDKLLVELAPAIISLTATLEKNAAALSKWAGAAGAVVADIVDAAADLAGVAAPTGGKSIALPEEKQINKAAEAAKNAAAELGKFMMTMQEKIITQDMTEQEKQLREFTKLAADANQGVVPEGELKQFTQMQKMIDLHKQQQEAIEQERAAYKKLADDAAAVGEKMRTPLEKLQDETKHLTEMFNAGLLDFVTFSRAAADLQKDFEKSLPKQEAPRSAGFMAEGSAAAFSAANAHKSNGLENIARQQLRKAGEAVAATAQVEAAIRNGFNTINTFVF